MENKCEVGMEELSQVTGGIGMNINGNVMEITLTPNESAKVELSRKLHDGIRRSGVSLRIEDPKDLLKTAARELDKPSIIKSHRKCRVRIEQTPMSVRVTDVTA